MNHKEYLFCILFFYVETWIWLENKRYRSSGCRNASTDGKMANLMNFYLSVFLRCSTIMLSFFCIDCNKRADLFFELRGNNILCWTVYFTQWYKQTKYRKTNGVFTFNLSYNHDGRCGMLMALSKIYGMFEV